jgi:hypothetical protein
MSKRKQPCDPALEEIDAYQCAIVQSHMDRVGNGVGYTADDIARERAAVEVLARNIADRLREEYQLRRTRS